MPLPTDNNGTILDVIHREPDTVLSTGTVRSAAELSLGTLREAQTAVVRSDGPALADAGYADAPESGRGQHPWDNLSQGAAPGKGRPASDAKVAVGTNDAASVGSGIGSGANGPKGTKAGVPGGGIDQTALPDDPLGVAGGGTRLPSGRLRDAAMSRFAEELDDSDELEGISDVYHGSRSARRAAGRMRGARAAGKGAKAASGHTAGGNGAAGTKGGSAATSSKKAGAVGTRKQAAAAAQAGGSAVQGQAVAAQAATSAATSAEPAAAIGAAAGTGLAAISGVIAGIVAFLLGILLVSHLVSAIFGFWENEEMKRTVQGLPPYITYSMVEEALRCQEEYGHPAGCTIAQIIVESGVGDHLSGLATQDSNLFGIKWSSSFASCPEVTGKSSWATYEEYDGEYVQVMADFTSFSSAEDCIRFRSRVLLQYDRYAGNALIQQAISDHDSDRMAEGLKDAGWATSSTYVDSLKSVMDTYNLRRFDGMSLDDFAASQSADGNAIVAAAYSQLGVPYVWGGSTPGVGLDCSGLTQYCYACAGIQIAHYTETQLAQGTAVPLSQAQPGDILYKYGHVAIYIGGDQYIHAPTPGDVVRVASGISYFTCAIRY